MNASRLKRVVDLLLEKEKKFTIQNSLNELNQQLANLAGSPQDATHQNNFATALAKLEAALAKLASQISPAEAKDFEEIGAGRFFSQAMVKEIQEWVSVNPLTPAVAHTNLQKLVTEREGFLNTIGQLQASLALINVKAETITEGQAEIGFLIPRELFKNELEQLIKELGALRQIIRAFSEVTIGTSQPIEVKEISTSDPLFFFGIDPLTVATLGAVVAWALNQWKKVEEIRKIRADTRKLNIYSDKDVEQFFDKKIESTINTAVEEKVQELLNGQKARTSIEHAADLKWAIDSLLARIERGMIVEVRFLPPPSTPEQTPEQAAAFNELKQVVPQLVFPKVEDTPMMVLPPPQPPEPKKKSDGK